MPTQKEMTEDSDKLWSLWLRLITPFLHTLTFLATISISLCVITCMDFSHFHKASNHGLSAARTNMPTYHALLQAKDLHFSYSSSFNRKLVGNTPQLEEFIDILLSKCCTAAFRNPSRAGAIQYWL